MFQHIMRCGVIGSAPEHQTEWFDQTIQYLEDRYHELSEAQVAELRTLGQRFCQPPKATQESVDAVQESVDGSQEAVDIGPETADSSEETAGSTAAA